MYLSDNHLALLSAVNRGDYLEFGTDPLPPNLHYLYRLGLIADHRDDTGLADFSLLGYKITQQGEAVLEYVQQEREQRAAQEAKAIEQEIQRIKERKQDRRDKWFIGIVSACGSSILTLCFEHFDELLVFFRNLLHP